jgi:hypothetical protein
MPMLYAVIGGGGLTMLGAGSSLYCNSVLERYGLRPIGFFEVLYIMGPCYVFMVIFVVIFSRTVLPNKKGLFQLVRF